MQNDVRKNKVGKSSLGADSFEMAFVLRIDLESQTNSEDEACNAGNEAWQEGIEGKGSNQTAVEKLNDASEKDIAQVGVNDLQLGRCVRGVPEMITVWFQILGIFQW